MRLQLNVHLLGILCQIFGHDTAGSKVHLVNAWFHLHAAQKTKHSPKKHPQNNHTQKHPLKTNIHGTALRPALHHNWNVILHSFRWNYTGRHVFHASSFSRKGAAPHEIFSMSCKASCSERHLLPHRLPRHSLVEHQQGS